MGKNMVADYSSRNISLCTIESKRFEKEIKQAQQLCKHGCANARYLFLKRHYKEYPGFCEVRNYVNRCVECLKFKPRKSIEIHPVLRNKPFETIGIETIGPLKKPKMATGI